MIQLNQKLGAYINLQKFMTKYKRGCYNIGITGNIGKKLRDGMEKYTPRKILGSYRIIRG